MVAGLGCHQIQAPWCLRCTLCFERGWRCSPWNVNVNLLKQLQNGPCGHWNSYLEECNKCWLQATTYNSCFPYLTLTSEEIYSRQACADMAITLRLSFKDWNPVDLTSFTTQNLFALSNVYVSHRPGFACICALRTKQKVTLSTLVQSRYMWCEYPRTLCDGGGGVWIWLADSNWEIISWLLETFQWKAWLD